MASDHYTQVHNQLGRGAIHTKYVGVYVYIASHREGWELTAARVAAALGVGEDFVGSALRALESAHCLIRTRERTPGGKLGGAIWFVTDLAMQMRDAGVSDDASIEAAVRSAYDQWLAQRAADEGQERLPVPDFPGQGATSENVADSDCFPRSAPNPGFPGQAKPVQVNPGTKKTKDRKKTVGKNPTKNSGAPGPSGPAQVRHARDRDDAARADKRTSSSEGDEDGPSTAAWAVLSRLPREWRDCPGWVRRRMAERIDRAMTDRLTDSASDPSRTRRGLGADAIVAGIAAYGQRDALADALDERDTRRHLAALSTVLATVRADVAGGSCPSCGHHHGQDPAADCSCCAGTSRHLTAVPDPRPATDQAIDGGSLVAAVPGHCDVCDRDDPTATVDANLPLPMSICRTCRSQPAADHEVPGNAPNIAAKSLTGASA